MTHFEELEMPILADPTRQARVERERAKVVAEQVHHAIAELRRARQVTQFELARALGRPQSSVSRIEREGDMLLSTLAAYVEALGGHLEITAVIDGHRVRLTEPDQRRSA